MARSSDGGGTWTDPVALSEIGASARVQDLVTDGSVWLLVWTTFNSDTVSYVADGEALFTRSTDAGATWSPPAALRTDWTTDGAYEDTVQLAADGKGTWLAVFYANETTDGGGRNRDFEARVVRSVDGGLTWSAPGYLEAGFSGETGDDFDPDVATDGKGTWLAAWTETHEPDRGLLLVRSTDAGATWSAPTEMDPGTSFVRDKASNPAIATDGTGTWVIAWTSRTLTGGTEEDDVVVVARASSTSGGGGGGGGPGGCRLERCVLDGVLRGAACGDQVVPRKVGRALERAFAKIAALETRALPAKKLARQRRTAGKLLRQVAAAARRATRGRRPKLSPACGDAIGSLADALAAGPCLPCPTATSTTTPPVSTTLPPPTTSSSSSTTSSSSSTTTTVISITCARRTDGTCGGTCAFPERCRSLLAVCACF